MTSSQIVFGIVLLVLATWVWRSSTASDRPDAGQVKPLYEQGAVFVDVRTSAEWKDGHLGRAVHLPLDDVPRRAAAVLPDRDAPIVVYCRSGSRSASAARLLRSMGYARVIPMRGGLSDLAAAGYPIAR